MEARERESIHRDLLSSDAEVRRLAVERVLLLSEAEALPRIVERLGDADWRVRKAAVDRVVTLPDSARVMDGLVACLADGENTGRRNAAVEALMRCGSRSVPALLEASASDDIDVRKLAVDTLGGIGDRRAVVRLLEMLDDPDANVRGAAADALGNAGACDAEAPLLARAADACEEPLVRLSALCGLRSLRAELRVMDLEPALATPLLRAAAFELLGDSDDPAACSVLLKGLASSSRSSREAAMRALLAALGRALPDEAERVAAAIRETLLGAPEAVRDAVERLAEVEPPMRLVLIQILGLAGGISSVVPILRAGCDDELRDVVLGTLERLGGRAEAAIDEAFDRLEPPERRLACDCLARTGGERARARLRAALADPEVEVRIAAADALGRCDDREALEALAARFPAASRSGDRDAEDELAALGAALMQVAARTGLGGRAVALLTERLGGAQDAERAEIARVLGRLGVREACPAATLLASDPSPAVRRAALESLAQLAPSSESLRLALADDSPDVRIAAAGCLEGFEAATVVDDLTRLCGDDDERVRSAAVRAIASLAATSSQPAEHTRLLELLSNAVGDRGTVAIAALEGLAGLACPDAARAALPALSREDPEIVQSAVRCLTAHGDAEVLAFLVPLVAHPHWLVRAEAIEAVARRHVVRAVPAILRQVEAEDDEFVRDVMLRALKRLED